MDFHPPRRRFKTGIALPASLLSETPHLREKTHKAGLVGRACAIYRVEEVVIYRDREDSSYNDAKLLADLLNFMNCPQYLKKSIFTLKPEFKFVGILPPLRTPNHPTESRSSDLPSVSFREGLVIKKQDSTVYVEVGLEQPVKLIGDFNVGERVVVRLNKDKAVKAYPSSFEEVPYYFGFRAIVDWGTLSRVVKGSKYNFILATSRDGVDINEVLQELKKRLSSNSTFILFGSPKEGLEEILSHEGLSLREISDLIVNFIPDQGVKTIRTEEALMSVLSIINLLS